MIPSTTLSQTLHARRVRSAAYSKYSAKYKAAENKYLATCAHNEIKRDAVREAASRKYKAAKAAADAEYFAKFHARDKKSKIK